MGALSSQILLVIPSLHGKGGVASYYNAVLKYMPTGSYIPLEIGGYHKAGGIIHPLIDQIRFRQTVKRVQPVLIHLNPSLDFKSFFRDGLFAWQAKRLGYPFVVFWHGWDKSFAEVAEKKHLGFFKKTLGRADAFIVLASEFGKKLGGWGITAPIHLGTTTVAENLLYGFDLANKLASRQVEKKIKLLFLARLERAKGVFETIEATRLLLDQNIPVSLTIAGDGSIKKELEAVCIKMNLSAAIVHFTGDIRGEDKRRVFAKHDIYCLPTYGEGMPTSVLEAMAFGLPVVTRPVGGLADMFEDGKMGVLVHGTSPEEIANGIVKIISDRSRMEEIGRYNAHYAKENFMASVVAKRLVDIYRTLY